MALQSSRQLSVPPQTAIPTKIGHSQTINVPQADAHDHYNQPHQQPRPLHPDAHHTPATAPINFLSTTHLWHSLKDGNDYDNEPDEDNNDHEKDYDYTTGI